jgi:hypothetical protein
MSDETYLTDAMTAATETAKREYAALVRAAAMAPLPPEQQIRLVELTRTMMIPSDQVNQDVATVRRYRQAKREAQKLQPLLNEEQSNLEKHLKLAAELDRHVRKIAGTIQKLYDRNKEIAVIKNGPLAAVAELENIPGQYPHLFLKENEA